MKKIFFHVDLDAFFASVEQRDKPDFKGLPVIVGAMPGHRGVVSTCSYEARKFGVHSAMPISEAYRRCPQALYLPVRMKRYCEVTAHIMEVLKSFTPEFRQVSVDEAFLDMTGTARLWGSPEHAASLVKEKIFAAEQLTISVGIASNPYVAKIASGLKKPDGLTLVREGEEADFMRLLPLSKLWGAGEKTRGRLQELGIYSIQALQDISCATLQSYFGNAAGVFLFDAAHGRDPGMFSRETGEHSLSGERTFERDTTDLETIESLLRSLADEISERLWAQGAQSRTIMLKMRYSDFSTISRRRTKMRPYAGSDEVWLDARELFRENWDKKTPIRLVGLGFADVDIHAAAQGELFSDNKERARIAENTVFELSRSGRGILRRARFIDPESARDAEQSWARSDRNNSTSG